MIRGSLALLLIILPFSLLYSDVEYTFQVSSFQGIKNVIVGYHPYATEGIDTSLGEYNLPPYVPNVFDARFRLFDTTLSTRKDLRYGCGQANSMLHILEWRYGNNIVITGPALNMDVYNISFIHPYTGTYLASLSNNDSVYFQVPPELDYVIIDVSYNGPLSWPQIIINSLQRGDLIPAGSEKTISWVSWLLGPQNINIEFSSDNGTTWNYIAVNLPFNQYSYNWNVPNITSNQCIIRVGNYPCVYQEVRTFFIYQGTQPQLEQVLIPITLKNGNNDIINLTAGLHPQATYGIDTALGEAPHTMGPPGTFDAAFYMQVTPYGYSRKDIQPGSHLYYGTRHFYFLIQHTLDSVVILEMNLPNNIFAELKYGRKMPYGTLPDGKYLGTGNIVYQIPKSALFQYNFFDLDFFYDFPVPVELVSFDAFVAGRNVKLTWVTATETNNKGFEIERRRDNTEKLVWDKIAFVNGNGTTTESQNYFYEDKNLTAGKYIYRLKQIDYDGSYEYSKEVEVEINIPLEFSLSQNYPNPFNPTTKIKYALPVSGLVTIKVYDILGNEIKKLVNEVKEPGEYEVEFNGNELSSGIYIYKLSAGSFNSARKLILLK